MTEVPKIVHDRLRLPLPGRDATGRAHPDADLLTAFAELALSATEREAVLQHLSLCGNCREVIALALPADEIVPSPTVADTESASLPLPAKWHTSWLGSRKLVWPSLVRPNLVWPNLRWAALAAGIVLAASVLLLHPGKSGQTNPPSPTPQATSSPGPSISVPATSLPSASSPSAPSSPSVGELPAVAKNDQGTRSDLQLSRKLRADQVVTPRSRPASGVLMADNRRARGEVDRLPPVGGPVQSSAYDAVTTEAAAVAGAAPPIASTPSPSDRLIARNEAPPIERAKPAPEGIETNNQMISGVAPAPAANLSLAATRPQALNITWMISGGILQRSHDHGQSWQNALNADHPLFCYATRNNEVWAGGQAGVFFHSADGGQIWVQVRPSTGSSVLSSDITHIEISGKDVQGPTAIVLSTSKSETWSSLDGGKTWRK